MPPLELAGCVDSYIFDRSQALVSVTTHSGGTLLVFPSYADSFLMSLNSPSIVAGECYVLVLAVVLFYILIFALVLTILSSLVP